MKECFSKISRWMRSPLAVLAAALLAQSCRMDMHDQPKYQPYEKSDLFADGSAMRRPPEGTVAQGFLRDDDLFWTGRVNGQESDLFPFPITKEVLERGQERFNIYCSPCHDRVGTGRGIIVMRGLKRPPSFHIVRLKEAPPSHFFDVMTNGFGVMFSYASRVSPQDRWAIAAYIKALQLSQGASYGEVPEEDIQRVEQSENDTPAENQTPEPGSTQPDGSTQPPQ